MPLIDLLTHERVILIILIWTFTPLASALFVRIMPERCSDPDGWLFRTRAWERDGHIYQQVFRIKSWKEKLPDGGALFKGGYSRKRLDSSRAEAIQEHLKWNTRGELSHWINLLPLLASPIFLEADLCFLILIYAVITNLPCLIAYRYNRPRIRRILQRKREMKLIDFPSTRT